MLDASTGDLVQRLTKLWIKPQNPEGTIRLMEFLKVDRFQDTVKKLSSFTVKKLEGETKGRQTNYTLRDSGMNALLDFATNQTTFNESIHLLGIPLGALQVSYGLMTGENISVAMGTGTLILNTYCVLAQRYSRARLTLTINKILQRHKEFNLKNYENNLGIRLPAPIQSQEQSSED